jgi:ferrous iron transport protein A
MQVYFLLIVLRAFPVCQAGNRFQGRTGKILTTLVPADKKDFRSLRATTIIQDHLMARVNLRTMSINQHGIITAVKVGGELGRRIREMGLVPGTEITIKQRAPLNDPVALRVMGGTLTLRNNEADYIEVEVE